MRATIGWLVLLLGLSACDIDPPGRTDDDDSALASPAARALFDWDPDHALDPSQRAAALAWAVSEGFAGVYQEAEHMVLNQPAVVPAYLAEADAAGLGASLLFG